MNDSVRTKKDHGRERGLHPPTTELEEVDAALLLLRRRRVAAELGVGSTSEISSLSALIFLFCREEERFLL